MTELLPTRAVYATDDTAAIEVRNLPEPALLRVRRLGEIVAEVPVGVSGTVALPALSLGGHSVELVADERTLARTAVEVCADRRSVLRYGFVVDYTPGRDTTGVTDNLRRLHLTAVQFYDWAYRHADLLGGGEDYRDALDQPVSLATVRALVEACHTVGAEALGYAAVYAVGPDAWPAWQHDALLTPTGAPYALGDFLFLVDPASKDWQEHFVADLRAATERLRFDGFHLDQYGYPKRAVRPDGETVDVAASFCSVIGGARTQLPASRLVFNNVNDFPTWATARCEQDAVYVEVWPPSVGLEHLAAVVTRARAVGDGKPVVVAAYQHVYDTASTDESDRATALTMATLFSHGATHLLCGEADRILVDPYYVRNHVVAPSTAALLQRWYDFQVAHTSLLMPPSVVDVTGSYAGGYNDDLDVTYDGVPVAGEPRAGAVWRRITSTDEGLVLHLVNLAGQRDTTWDAPRRPQVDVGAGTLRVRRTGRGVPRVRVADPDRQPHLVDLAVTLDGDWATAVLPPPSVWQVVLVQTDGTEGEQA